MSEEKSSPAPAPADRVLVMERIFDAPRHLVFEAWTEQEHLEKWTAPRGFTVPFSEGEVKPGGKWRCHMIAPDGGMHRAVGVYREIVPDKLLVFTHGWEQDDGTIDNDTVIRVEFLDAEGGKTRMKFDQRTFATVESRNGHEEGWTECFEKLGEMLAGIKTGEKS